MLYPLVRYCSESACYSIVLPAEQQGEKVEVSLDLGPITDRAAEDLARQLQRWVACGVWVMQEGGAR